MEAGRDRHGGGLERVVALRGLASLSRAHVRVLRARRVRSGERLIRPESRSASPETVNRSCCLWFQINDPDAGLWTVRPSFRVFLSLCVGSSLTPGVCSRWVTVSPPSCARLSERTPVSQVESARSPAAAPPRGFSEAADFVLSAFRFSPQRFWRGGAWRTST